MSQIDFEALAAAGKAVSERNNETETALAEARREKYLARLEAMAPPPEQGLGDVANYT